MKANFRRGAAGLCVLALTQCIGAGSVAAQSTKARAFDRRGWLADYAALKQELERSYSHLAWFGSPQGGVNLPVLERATRRALERSRTDAEASAAITAFVAAFHDGHLAPASAPAAPGSAAAEPPEVERAADARTACAAFGYAPLTRVAFSLPFESLPGFELTSDGLATAFRSGILELDGRRIGIVRIPRFRPAEFPQVCERAWESLRRSGTEPTRSAIRESVDGEWLRTLAERLAELRARNATVLLVDVGGNGGGNDLGDWAVRLFSRAPVRSAPLLLSASPVAVPYYDEELEGLRAALDSAQLPEATRTALGRAVAEFEARKRQASRGACDMSWVWRERHPWGTSGCTRLVESGYASGALAYAEPGSLDPRAARALYWAAIADSLRGVWNGRTYVLTDTATGSAAEMFTALIRDRGIAKTVGTHTFGLGCGFLDADEPFVLPRSRLAFRVPNCVRLRGDGTDEVAGVAPDLPVPARPGESPRARAARTLRAIADDASANAAHP